MPIHAPPSDSPACTLGAILADRLRDARDDIAGRWLERIAARVALAPENVFPTSDLLDHVPLLIDGIAAYLEHAEADIDSAVPVSAKARELGAMRHEQGFGAHQILKEQELLGAIILAFLEDVVEDIDVPCTRRELVACFRRAGEAIEIVRQTTTNHFLQLWADRAHEREHRLRRFNRMVSHELRNRVTAIQGAANLLEEDWLDDDRRRRLHRLVIENGQALHQMLENLEALSHLDSDARQQRNILLPQAAAEVVRQLRSQAQSASVDVRIDHSLPAIEVNAAAVELCLANYLSNAIKYSDASRKEKWVEISGDFRPREASGEGGELIIRVRDNGIGIPAESRERLFQQFYRAHSETITEVSGTGLGLSIVRETAEALGGRAWAEFPEDGTTVFAFSLPSRREEDAAAAGITRDE